MANTGLINRTGLKADLEIELPLQGEIVYATDTKEFGVLDSGGGANWTNFVGVEWGTVTGDILTQTDLQTILNNKVNNSQVLTDVPAGALFTDTVYDDTTLAGRVTQNETDIGLKQNDLGFGTLGQILATNATVDGTEWIDNYDDTTIQGEVDLNTAKISYDVISSARVDASFAITDFITVTGNVDLDTIDTDVGTHTTEIGTLTNLTTTQTDLVIAINEVNAKVGVAVADITNPAADFTEVSTKINELLASLRTAGLLVT